MVFHFLLLFRDLLINSGNFNSLNLGQIYINILFKEVLYEFFIFSFC